jgi:hypothetical protein
MLAGIQAGAVKRMLEDLAERNGTTFEHEMEALMNRAPVRRQRAPQVDRVNTEGTDATLGLRTPGIGTITFDTSFGTTMVTGAKGPSLRSR